MTDLGVYIHIPFCLSKCGYCDFVSKSGMEALYSPYTDALLKEIKSFDFSGYNIKTVFIGGGTPTVLPSRILERLLLEFKKQSPLEITVETNPNSTNREALEALKASGATRLSIGLQAWQEAILKTLGRTHTNDDFIKCFNNGREAGFDNINVDLMFSLPGQTLYDLTETIKRVIELAPEHISLYSLTIEEGAKSEIFREPDEELDREMYYAAKKLLADKKYIQYEISNFALENFECKHNLAYWDRKDYKGFGASAHSFLNGVRMRNVNDIEEYILKNKIEDRIVLSLDDAMEEFMFLGLRKTKGIDVLTFKERFGKSVYDAYGEKLCKFISGGFVKSENNRLFLTDKGMDVSNIIFSEFLL